MSIVIQIYAPFLQRVYKSEKKSASPSRPRASFQSFVFPPPTRVDIVKDQLVDFLGKGLYRLVRN